ncbi:hypothetical protein BGZ72_003529 [Mortierella alpina]|nr:hypothetical protein BGZ72_003529 [Mortierella alpina]
MANPEILDQVVPDAKKNSRAAPLEADEVAQEICSKMCAAAYPAMAIPGERDTAIAAEVAASIVATSVDGASVDPTNSDATTTTTAMSNSLASQPSAAVGHKIKVRKPTLSFARRTYQS